MSFKHLALALLAAMCFAGCQRASTAQTTSLPGPTPTFNKDVAPILFQNCVTCHRTGQQAVPFTLLEFAEARKRADRIAKVTLARHMPPWPPDPVDPGFVGERRLTPEQIDVIQRWA